MLPKISIIVPVYNIETVLSRCLNSLISQTMSDIEIICVDDCSKDSSLSILREYANKDVRIKVISQENKGPGGARNRGLDEAVGEFILFIDGDDYIEERYCELMYNCALRHGADMVVVGMKKVYSTYSKSRYYVEKEESFDQVQSKIDAVGYNSLFYVMNKLFRRDLLNSIPLRFVEGVYYEDVIFMITVFYYSGRMVTLPGVNYMYVNYSSGITKGKLSDKKQEDRYRAHKALVEFCENHNIQLEEKRKSVTVRIWTVFGVTIFKIKEKGGRRFWRLFDLITLYTKQK